MRFLIIDDNPADRELIVHHIRREFERAEITEVASQGAFEDALEQDSYDLVLCDYALGWSNGLTVVARVQARSPSVPVVMVTDSGNEEVAVQALKQGFSDYILKRHLDRLPTAIREGLDRAGLRRENARMAAQLRLSEERYRQISSLTSDYAFAYRITAEGGSVSEWVTDAFYRITGYTEQEVIAAGGWMFMLHPEDEAVVQAHRARLLAGRSDVVEYRILTREGARRWLRVVSRPEMDPETGGVVRIYGAAQDITERKLAEDALRASEARFRAVFDNAALGIAVANHEGQLLDVNPALARLLRYSCEQLTGMHVTDLTHPDDWPSEHVLIEELLARARASYEVERRLIRGDGEIIWGKLVVSVVEPAEGTAPMFVGVLEDITQQRAALAALIEAEKLALTGTLAASIAHEVNNPMQAVVGCVGLAMEKLEGAADVPDFDPQVPLQLLGIATREMQRAGHIIAQLRDLNRRSLPLAWRTADVGDLVESVLTLSAGETSRAGVEVIKEVEPDLPPVMLVPSRMQQVLVGLILNAIAAMPSGGKLRVVVKLAPPSEVVIEVVDSGSGIRPEDMQRLFEPFFTTKEQGVGLGLHLSRNIIREHGGDITVHSTVGNGTTVEVRLPIAEGG